MVGGTYGIFAMSFALAHALRMKFGLAANPLYPSPISHPTTFLTGDNIIFQSVYNALKIFTCVSPLGFDIIFSQR